MKSRKLDKRKTVLFLILAAALGAAACNPPPAGGGPECPPPSRTKILYLRAEPFTMTMSDGATVPMWGYAQDTFFGAYDGVVSSPGPEMQISHCANEVLVRLDNNLPMATSIVINGQVSEMTPVYNPDGRVRSLTQETLPGNTAYVEYQFNNFRAGTYLYQSGTWIQVQRQMGLYGAIFKNLARNFAYGGVGQEVDFRGVYSEIDPDLHFAVATNQFGAGLAMTSSVDYYPKYFLINGVEYDAGTLTILPPALNGKRTLFRILNAGLKPRTFMLASGHFQAVAEDGNPYTYPLSRYAIQIEAGSTKDVIFNLPGDIAVAADRALGF